MTNVDFDIQRDILAQLRHASFMRDGSEHREEAYECLRDAFAQTRSDILAARTTQTKITRIPNGTLVDAEYIEGIGGRAAVMRGVVIGSGEWNGQATHSVYGIDAHGELGSTSSSTMPVRPVAEASTREALDYTLMLAARTSSVRMTSKLNVIALIASGSHPWDD